MAEIIARRVEVTPRFLRMLEDIDQNPEPWLADQERMIHIYGPYLLVLSREIDVNPLPVPIFSLLASLDSSWRATWSLKTRGPGVSFRAEM